MNFYLITTGIMLFLQLVIPTLEDRVPALLSLTTGERIALALEEQQPDPDAPLRIIDESVGVDITAQAACVVDVASGVMLWEKNPDEVRSIASITKLATLMVVRDYITDYDQEVTIIADDFIDMGYQTFGIGDVITVRDLLATVIIRSDNTATHALVRATGLSRVAVVDLMNEKAAQLGLTVTRFVDPTGLANANVSSAREVLQFARDAFADPLIRSFAGRREYIVRTAAGKEYTIISTDKLLGSMIDVRAGKTGYVEQAGYNFVAEAERDKHLIRAVVLGSASDADRFQDYKMLAHWIWEHFIWP